jgi:hypothetical protein
MMARGLDQPLAMPWPVSVGYLFDAPGQTMSTWSEPTLSR